MYIGGSSWKRPREHQNARREMNDTREEGTETGDAVTWGVHGARRKEAEG